MLVELEKEKLWHEIEQMRVEKEYEPQQVSDREFQSDPFLMVLTMRWITFYSGLKDMQKLKIGVTKTWLLT